MAIDFPNSPSLNQTYTFNNITWIWNGSAWVRLGVGPNYVVSFNGLTGAVTGVTTGVANTFGPLQSFTNGISSAGATFTAAPSYAGDPVSGNELSRKTYVDDRTRIGAVAFVAVQSNAIVSQSTPGQFYIVSSQLRGPTGQTWYGTLTYWNAGAISFTANVTSTSGPGTSGALGTNGFLYVLVRTA